MNIRILLSIALLTTIATTPSRAEEPVVAEVPVAIDDVKITLQGQSTTPDLLTTTDRIQQFVLRNKRTLLAMLAAAGGAASFAIGGTIAYVRYVKSPNVPANTPGDNGVGAGGNDAALDHPETGNGVPSENDDNSSDCELVVEQPVPTQDVDTVRLAVDDAENAVAAVTYEKSSLQAAVQDAPRELRGGPFDMNASMQQPAGHNDRPNLLTDSILLQPLDCFSNNPDNGVPVVTDQQLSDFSGEALVVPYNEEE